MFIDVLQNRWLVLALVGGAALVLLVVLANMALWRPRDSQASAEAAAGGRQPFLRWLRSFMPWVLVLTLVGIAAFVVIYTLAMAANPPNW